MSASRVRQRRIAGELRRLRDLSGLSGESVAGRLGWSVSKLSRIERYRTGITLADLNRLLDVYKGRVPEYRMQALLDLAHESSAAPAKAARMQAADDEEASVLLEWGALAIPRILQTEGYAKALLLSTQPISGTLPGAITRSVEATALWQSRLTAERPMSVEVILDESVLHRICGSQDVMAAQTERLLEAAALPNVQLRVLPLASGGPAGIGSFRYLRFDPVHRIEAPDVVVIEHVRGTVAARQEEVMNALRYHPVILAADPTEVFNRANVTGHGTRERENQCQKATSSTTRGSWSSQAGTSG